MVHGPARFWDQKTLLHIMTARVIMQNKIIENKREQLEDFYYNCGINDEAREESISNQETFGSASKDVIIQ